MGQKHTDNILGVFASFENKAFAAVEETAQFELRKKQFKEYLWGKDANGGLSKKLKELRAKGYGKDVSTILLQFSVCSVMKGSIPVKDIENYRPKEKSIGVWIAVNNENFFQKGEAE